MSPDINVVGHPWADAVKPDLYYVDSWSAAPDATIMWRTVRVVLAGSGC